MLKILVIDEDRHYCDILSRHADLFEQHGPFRIEFSSTYGESLEIIDGFNPSVVILDVFALGKEGFELLSYCDWLNIPVIATTPEPSRELQNMALSSGASGYVPKGEDLHFIEFMFAAIDELTTGLGSGTAH